MMILCLCLPSCVQLAGDSAADPTTAADAGGGGATTLCGMPECLSAGSSLSSYTSSLLSAVIPSSASASASSALSAYPTGVEDEESAVSPSVAQATAQATTTTTTTTKVSVPIAALAESYTGALLTQDQSGHPGPPGPGQSGNARPPSFTRGEQERLERPPSKMRYPSGGLRAGPVGQGSGSGSAGQIPSLPTPTSKQATLSGTPVATGHSGGTTTPAVATGPQIFSLPTPTSKQPPAPATAGATAGSTQTQTQPQPQPQGVAQSSQPIDCSGGW